MWILKAFQLTLLGFQLKIEVNMPTWEINLIVIILCAGCKLIGELWWHNAQRFIMPLILAADIFYSTHVWYLGLSTLLVIADITQGYGPKSWMYKLLGDAGARGMWLFLAAFLIGIGPFLTHHLSWFIYIPYCILAGILGATTRNLWNVIIAPIAGAWLGLIVFIVR